MKNNIKEILIGINYLLSMLGILMFIGGILLVIDVALFNGPDADLAIQYFVGGGLLFGVTYILGESVLSQ